MERFHLNPGTSFPRLSWRPQRDVRCFSRLPLRPPSPHLWKGTSWPRLQLLRGRTPLAPSAGVLPANGEEWHAIRKGDLKLYTRFNRLAASPSADVAAASTTKSLPPIHVSMEFSRLLKRMMHPDPARRPTCAELLKEALLRSDVELRRAAKEDLLRRQFLSAVGHDPARPTSCPPRLFRPLH